MSKAKRRARAAAEPCSATCEVELGGDAVTLTCDRPAGHAPHHNDPNIGPWECS